MREFLQHIFNSRHVYCRLRDLGLSKNFAKKLSVRYEKFTHAFLYS